MKQNLNNKNIIIVSIAVFLLVISVLLLIFSKKGQDINDKINDNPKVEEGEIYITNDKRFTLKIVDSSSEDAIKKAKNRYGVGVFDELVQQNAKLYGYFNNRVLAIDDVLEDDNYALYSFIGLPTEEFGHKVLVNKKTKKIEVSEDDLQKTSISCMDNGFCGFQSQPGYLKGPNGYYFINNDNGFITVYTTSWKKIGYIDKLINLKMDSEGNIYLYERVNQKSCNGSYCEYEGSGELVKYDVNGGRK